MEQEEKLKAQYSEESDEKDFEVPFPVPVKIYHIIGGRFGGKF
jgi:hypothetical protein